MNYQEIKEKRAILASFPYQWKAMDKGYSDQSLYVNVESNKVEVRGIAPKQKRSLSEEKAMVSGCSGMRLNLRLNGRIPKMK